jgi:4-hydroxy-tetrahydrodipicolinate reductase
MSLKLTIVGATGQMGKNTLFFAMQDPDFEIVGAVASTNSRALNKDIGSLIGETKKTISVTSDLENAFAKSDVIIDFSIAGNLDQILSVATHLKKPLVIGTTGYSATDLQKLEKASEFIPILYSPNFSIGMAICKFLVQESAKRFKNVSNVAIVETHHSQKKDAPSGSAKKLAQILEKENKKVTMHSIRAGTVVGEHAIHFIGDEESLLIEHRVQTRATFAKGALMAAKFLIKQKAGRLYSIDDLF